MVGLAARPGLTVAAVTCSPLGGRHGAGWSPPEGHAAYRLVLVRRGRFRRRVRGQVADLDPSVGYLGLPGDEEHFAHPAGGDVCTSVQIGPALWRALTREEPGPSLTGGGPAGHAVYVDARVDLAHRRLVRAARAGDVEHAVVERLVALLAGVVRTPDLREPPHHDLALVARAREAIRADDPAAGGLLPLAALLGVSPFRLSRAFSRYLGVPVTRYRNRVRVERALDRLEAGADDLAALAADLGFADQAHLCRTMRQHLGEPPSAVRRLLA
ncbi:AraC family transcriptional regulator [Virgisporangium ochraceum]|uniref:AraC family transcriptional regulator n=1 Tax=Virgisporangium ochraceum TaxID=65505 RepID=A0A8J4A0N2_9ACTN|nr:AraC family transcriptional regulator [Virgisporangium ochraceum]